MREYKGGLPPMQSLKNVKKTALVSFFLRKPCFILQILTEDLTLRSFLLSKYTKGSCKGRSPQPWAQAWVSQAYMHLSCASSV